MTRKEFVEFLDTYMFLNNYECLGGVPNKQYIDATVFTGLAVVMDDITGAHYLKVIDDPTKITITIPNLLQDLRDKWAGRSVCIYDPSRNDHLSEPTPVILEFMCGYLEDYYVYLSAIFEVIEDLLYRISRRITSPDPMREASYELGKDRVEVWINQLNATYNPLETITICLRGDTDLRIPTGLVIKDLDGINSGIRILSASGLHDQQISPNGIKINNHKFLDMCKNTFLIVKNEQYSNARSSIDGILNMVNYYFDHLHNTIRRQEDSLGILGRTKNTIELFLEKNNFQDYKKRSYENKYVDERRDEEDTW